MEARLVQVSGMSKEACKARQVDRMFAATKKVLQAEGLNFSADEAAKKFRYNMVSNDHDTDFKVTIAIKPHFAIINCVWTKAVPEPRRAAVTVFCMAFNNALKHAWSKVDIDQRDGEFRVSTALPVGVMAAQPEGMLKFYVEMAALGTNVTLAGVQQVAFGTNNDPLKRGDASAKLVNLIVDAKLASH